MLFLLKKIAVRFFCLDRIDSTNAYLLRFPEQDRVGTVVSAMEQTAGKGMADTSLESAPGQNLTFSMGVDMSFLKAADQFVLSEAVPLAVLEVLDSLLLRAKVPGVSAESLSVKWPNDLYYGDRKLGGILISRTIHGDHMGVSVVGIGLNVNQTQFQDWPVPPVSLKMILGRELELVPLMERLVTAVNRKRELLRMEEGLKRIGYGYLNRLYRYHQWADYEVNGARVRLFIMGIDPFGRLFTQDEHMREHVFDIKEIRFLLEDRSKKTEDRRVDYPEG